jgi:hypothetical protein
VLKKPSGSVDGVHTETILVWAVPADGSVTDAGVIEQET